MSGRAGGQRQSRETYDRGNGAVLLLFNVDRATVVLTRQFRFPAYVNGCPDGLLIEACAGLLDGEDPTTCIRREAEEETGFVVRSPRKILEAYMSPGSVTEEAAFLCCGSTTRRTRYPPEAVTLTEGEDIEVIEVRLADALRMIALGAHTRRQDDHAAAGMLRSFGLDKLRDHGTWETLTVGGRSRGLPDEDAFCDDGEVQRLGPIAGYFGWPAALQDELYRKEVGAFFKRSPRHPQPSTGCRSYLDAPA